LKSLLIFYRNPQIGKVKTRLAKTVGDEKALAIYLHLATHTRAITQELECDKIVYYSDFVDTEDAWQNSSFEKKIQKKGKDLGEKMMDAFAKAFNTGYSSVCIIGTDCYELSSEIIDQAFQQLKTHDAVIGPAKDGGYYLLGMNKLISQLFQNKTWSTSSVANDTMNDFKRLGLSFAMLPSLTDVDEEKDLPISSSRISSES
jgi:uncharacterized protein